MTVPLNETEHFYEAELETLLFVAAGPVTVQQLAETLQVSQEVVEKSLVRLETTLQQGRGVRLQWSSGRVQLTTAPEMASLVERFLGLEATTKLSRAALETLTIIAYKQPVTRPGIDAIRGVSSDGVLKSLLYKGLIQEVGRAEGPGRPILYGTTADFLQYFGLASLEELPPVDLEGTISSETNNGLLKD